jgi:hypothetical protein
MRLELGQALVIRDSDASNFSDLATEDKLCTHFYLTAVTAVFPSAHSHRVCVCMPHGLHLFVHLSTVPRKLNARSPVACTCGACLL